MGCFCPPGSFINSRRSSQKAVLPLPGSTSPHYGPSRSLAQSVKMASSVRRVSAQTYYGNEQEHILFAAVCQDHINETVLEGKAPSAPILKSGLFNATPNSRKRSIGMLALSGEVWLPVWQPPEASLATLQFNPPCKMQRDRPNHKVFTITLPRAKHMY